MTRPLAKILEKTPVVANMVCPGYCYSELRRELETQWSKRMMFYVMDKVMARTSDEGARQYVWAALAENTDGRMRGAYCDSMRILETSDYSLSKEGLAAEETFWVRKYVFASSQDLCLTPVRRFRLT